MDAACRRMREACARHAGDGFIEVKKNLRVHEPADMISLLSDVGP